MTPQQLWPHGVFLPKSSQFDCMLPDYEVIFLYYLGHCSPMVVNWGFECVLCGAGSTQVHAATFLGLGGCGSWGSALASLECLRDKAFFTDVIC